MSIPRFVRVFLVTLCLLVVVGLVGSQPTEAATPTVCATAQLPVALVEGQPASYTVVGTLCGKRPFIGRTIHVLVPGATYNRGYWDFSLRPEQYSYVKAMTEAGYATLSLDRIGIGASSHPPADQVNVDTNAFVIHQVVQALRAGRAQRVFPRVILVGHSLGSAIAITEASRFQDVDGVIVSGFLHTITPAFQNAGTVLYPAQQDPRFQTSNLPAGYLTSLPGVRGPIFYYAPTAEADVVALDEATKETVTLGELNGLAAVILTPSLSQAIQVPVLSVVGDNDIFFCDTVPACPNARTEAQFFAPQAQFELQVVHDTGHDLNLHTTAPTWFAIAREWSNRRFGP